MEGTIDISTSGTTHCVPCTEGLTCPDGSTVEKLKSGSTEDEKTAKIVSGYFSWAEDPTEVFKCPGTHCPGRRPGTCEGGRLGPTCDECGAGMYWADDECRICEVSMVAAWIAGPILVLLAMVVAYYVTDDKYTARASLGECASIGTDMMVAFVQQLGILSAVSVPWPATLKNLFEFSSVFVLNLQSLGFSCASSHGVQQYVLSALFFIAVVTTLPCLGYLTQFCSCMRHRGLNWDFYKTVCVTGKFLQSGFTTMCNIGLVPFMCFLHPNGRRSILKYPHTFCGSADHGMMQLFGILVLVLSLTHFILCITQPDSRHWILHWQLPPIVMVVWLGPFGQGTPVVLACRCGSQHARHPTCFDALCFISVFGLATLVLTMESSNFEPGGCNLHGFVLDAPGNLIALGTCDFRLAVLFGFLRDWHVLRKPGSHRLRFHFCFGIGALAALLFETGAYAEYREPGSGEGSRRNPGDPLSRHRKTGM